ncbi:MAG: hypothetical protein GY869_07965 [Planctomycetes bacterium]|nr:hypothetical protein [Planctomycetota bacterium]
MSIFQNADWYNRDWFMQDGLDYPRLAWEGTGGVPIPAALPIPLNGSGTENDPYQLWTSADFVLLSWHVSVLDKNLILMTDLDLSGVTIYPIGDVGPFTGSDKVGGLCGDADTGGDFEDTSNFWDTVTSQTNTSAMGTGKRTNQMKTKSTFTTAGWDLVGHDINQILNPWRMCADDVDYPRHNWENKIKGDFLCPNSTGLLDLAYLNRWWLSNPTNPFEKADANGDKNVNLLDFARLAAHWLN